VRKWKTLVSAYADAYRVQIHRISETADAAVDGGQLPGDVDLLRDWNATGTADLAEKRA
jgi:hypothetical protein